MATLREIMTTDLVTVESDMTLREALDALRARDVLGAPVVEGSQIVGVVSASDFLDFEADSPGIPPERREMLEWGELDVSEEVDGEESPAAYFSERWLDAEGDVWTRITETESPEWDLMDEHTVSEIMSRRLIYLPPDATMSEAAHLLTKEGLHRVLVVENGALIGIVSASDIVRAVAVLMHVG